MSAPGSCTKRGECGWHLSNDELQARVYVVRVSDDEQLPRLLYVPGFVAAGKNHWEFRVQASVTGWRS